ncbi:hypothetical protein D3C85_1493120 [compost metagenome]
MHALAEHQPGFHLALEAVLDRLVGFFQELDDVLHVPPEIGTHRYLECLAAMGGYGEPGAGFAGGKLHVIEVDGVDQPAHGQADVVGIVDAKTQHELLLQKLGAHHVHLQQAHVGVLETIADPGGASTEARKWKGEEKQ